MASGTDDYRVCCLADGTVVCCDTHKVFSAQWRGFDITAADGVISLDCEDRVLTEQLGGCINAAYLQRLRGLLSTRVLDDMIAISETLEERTV